MQTNRDNFQAHKETISTSTEEKNAASKQSQHQPSATELQSSRGFVSHNFRTQETDAQSYNKDFDTNIEGRNPIVRRKEIPPPSTPRTNTNNKMSVQNLISEDCATEHFSFLPLTIRKQQETKSLSHCRRSLQHATSDALQRNLGVDGTDIQSTFQREMLHHGNQNRLVSRDVRGQHIWSHLDIASGRDRVNKIGESCVIMDNSIRGEKGGNQLFRNRGTIPSFVDKIPSSGTQNFIGKAPIMNHSKSMEISSLRISKGQNQTMVIEPKAKRPWTEQEDALLRSLVEQLGQGLWAAIAAQIPGRTGKQVRERWLNHLSPNVTKRPWSAEEDAVIIESHQRFGNCWSRIAKTLHGRSDNSVKNRFYTTLRRRIANPSNSGVRENHMSNKRRSSPTIQKPSEHVEIVNRRYKQARLWE